MVFFPPLSRERGTSPVRVGIQLLAIIFAGNLEEFIPLATREACSLSLTWMEDLVKKLNLHFL
jgi:hypothetical protein